MPVFIKGGGGKKPKLQAKDDIAPSTSIQIITPDEGYDGLSQVTVAKVKSRVKNIAPRINSGILYTPGNDEWFAGAAVAAALYAQVVQAIDDKTIKITYRYSYDWPTSSPRFVAIVKLSSGLGSNGNEIYGLMYDRDGNVAGASAKCMAASNNNNYWHNSYAPSFGLAFGDDNTATLTITLPSGATNPIFVAEDKYLVIVSGNEEL